MSRFLDPYIALDQFNTGYAQQSQTMAARQQAEQERQRMAMAQQEQAFQESRFGYQQGQDSIDNEFRQGESARQASQFGQRQNLDERQFGLATDQFAMQQAQEAEELKQRQVKAAALREYVRRRSSKLRGAGAGGAQAMQALPPGGGVMSMRGGMPQAAGAAPSMDMNFGMGQDERPTMAPQQGEGEYDGMQGGGPGSLPAADLSEEQQFANSIADLMDTLDVEGLPQSEVMRQVDEYSNLVIDAQKKQRAMKFWQSKGPRFAHKVEEIQADLSAAEMQLLEKDAARTWSSNSANPEFQQRVADQMRLNPKAPRANVEAWVREDIQNGVNQNRTNLSGEEREEDPVSKLMKLQSALKVGDWESNPTTAKSVEMIRDRIAALVAEKLGIAPEAGGEKAAPGKPISVTGVSGATSEKVDEDAYRKTWAAVMDEAKRAGRKFKSHEEVNREVLRRMGVAGQTK